MRILYGVHGYGRGHATRALAVLPHLAERHQLLILAGGDAYQTISPEYPVIRIPTVGFAYNHAKGPRRRSNWQTFRRNLPAVLDLFCQGPTLDLVCEIMSEFTPDVVISDAEGWTHHAAAARQVPRISFDHIGIMTYCRPSLETWDRVEAWLDTTCYKMLMGRPDRVIVSSFFDAAPRRPGVRVVGTLPRQAVRDLQPHAGDHLLVYLNRGVDQLNDRIVESLQAIDLPVHIYGVPRQTRLGKLVFLPPSNLPFLEDLASCKAVVSTAGNQLVGEAMHLGKPVLVFPERCVEQRMNALAVEKLGIGMRAPFGDFKLPRLRAFLERLDDYAGNIQRHRRDGLQEALDALDRFLYELAPRATDTAVGERGARAPWPQRAQ